MKNQAFEHYAEVKPFKQDVAPGWSNIAIECFARTKKKFSDITVLDYGCGDGRYFPILVRIGLSKNNIHGVEVSRRRIERCKQLGWDSVNYIENGQELPFEDNYFDFINMMEVIEHIPKGSIEDCLTEIHRVMKKSGSMLIATPNYPIKRFYDLYSAIYTKDWRRVKDDPTHVTHYNKNKIEILLNRYFENISIMPYKIGFIYKYIRKDVFMHKMFAVCANKR